MTSQRAPVAIIGGGWAGCAAALTVAASGRRVVLYEAASTLGGRARRVTSDGLPLDNGQHLMLGAYVEARRAILFAHAPSNEAPFTLQPLSIAPFSSRQDNAIAMRARRLPPPWNLLAGLLSTDGLSLRARIATAAWFARLRRRSYRCAPAETVANLLAPLPAESAARLWAPLCVAALNTSPQRSSARIFAEVLRVAFDGAADASDLLVHTADLSALFPDAAMRWLIARGHEIHLQATVRIDALSDEGALVAGSAHARRASGVVVAVGPHQLARTIAPELAADRAELARAIAQVERLTYEPIVTVYLGYAGVVVLPRGLVRLDDRPGQWIFDRRDILSRAEPGAPALETLVAVVISASGPHEALAHADLVAAVDAQLRRLTPSLPSLVWSKVIAERRATFACTPGAERPHPGRLCDGIYLAGDYTDPQFPATLESAVKSGRLAAKALLADESE